MTSQEDAFCSHLLTGEVSRGAQPTWLSSSFLRKEWCWRRELNQENLTKPDELSPLALFTHFAWSARERAGFVSSETKVLNPNKCVAQSCPTLCNPMDCSLWGSSVHGIFQARVLEWVAISFSRGSSRPRDWTRVSCIAGRHFTL